MGSLTPPSTAQGAPRATDDPSGETASISPSAPSAAPPDWGVIDRSVLCPLCDYDLRGLVEPRCPECGYAFAWPELLDADLAPHPYLFEHHPRRNVRSFARTLIGTLRPTRFWRSIAPTQPISVRRIVIYWLIVGTIIVMGSAGGRFAASAVRFSFYHQTQRRQMLATHGNPPDPYTAPLRWMGGGSVGAYIDRAWPLPHQAHFWRVLWQRDSATWLAMKIGLCAAAWPLLVLLTLTIFARTIRRSAIKRAHLLRCAVYSADLFVFLLVLPALMVTGSAMFGPMNWYGDSGAMVVSLLSLGALTTYHLGVAFKRYLRFPHAAATAVAVQFIVILTVIVYLLQDREAWQVVIQLF